MKFLDDVEVKLVDHMGGDTQVCHSARVSTVGAEAPDTAESAGLIDYLIRNRHMTPVESSVFTWMVKCPIGVSREAMRHRIACVSGDTSIALCSKTTHKEKRHYPISTIWENWHLGVPDSKPSERKVYIKFRKSLGDWRVYYINSSGGRSVVEVGAYNTGAEAQQAAEEVDKITWRRRKLPSTRNLWAVSIDEETGLRVKNKILDVVKSGMKETFTYETQTGQKIKATKDHRFYTPDGWKPGSELRVGDYVMVSGRIWPKNESRKAISNHLRIGIGLWSSQQRSNLIEEKDNCYLCGGIFKREELELDHVVPVVVDIELALSASNLKPACISCHRIKTDSEQILATRQGAISTCVPDVITSIEFFGEEMTYDLVMDEPHHNFLANNFVVHNSYNEWSSRYSQIKAEFYIASKDRNLVQQGKAGEYVFVPGTPEQYELYRQSTGKAYGACWAEYEWMLKNGIAKELARNVLPLGTYTSYYVTMNARSLMNFLSLRTKNEDSLFPSFPLREIEMVAERMEEDFKELMPLTYQAWNKHGRV